MAVELKEKRSHFGQGITGFSGWICTANHVIGLSVEKRLSSFRCEHLHAKTIPLYMKTILGSSLMHVGLRVILVFAGAHE